MERVSFSEQVRVNLDAEAARILQSLVRVEPPAPRTGRAPASVEEVEPVAHLVVGENLTRAGPVCRYNDAGDLCGARLVRSGSHFVLDEAVGRRVDDLARATTSQPEFEGGFGFDSCRRELLAWLEQHAGAESGSWVKWVTRSAAEQVRDWDLWVPIDGVHLDQQFDIGSVHFDFMRREQAASIAGYGRIDTTDPRVAARVEERAREFQGQPYGRVSVRGDHHRACELASVQVDAAVNLLRFYAPSVTEPLVPTLLARRGETWPGTVEVGLFESDQRVVQPSAFTRRAWSAFVDERFLRSARNLGLDRLASTLDGSGTQFERCVLTAVMAFSRGALHHDMEVRFLHAVAAAESLYVRSRERKRANLVRRVGAVVGALGDDAAAAESAVSAAYRYRSRWVHEVRPMAPEAIHEAREALLVLWKALAYAAVADASITTKSTFLRRVDRLSSGRGQTTTDVSQPS